MIQTIFKSEKDKQKLEKLNVSNSVQYVEYIKRNQLNFLFNQNGLNGIKEGGNLRREQLEVQEIIQESSNLVKTYSEKILAYAEKKEKNSGINSSEELEGFEWGFPLKQSDIFVNLFRKRELVYQVSTENLSQSEKNPSLKNNNNYYQQINICEEIDKLTGKFFNF